VEQLKVVTVARVRIYRGKGFDEEGLKNLLEEAGCGVSAESGDGDREDAEASATVGGPEELEGDPQPEVGAEDDQEGECEPDVLVVVLTPELYEDDELEGVLRGETSRGSVIVGVWPRGASSGTAPPAFKKYSSDQVIWDREAIRRAICGDAAEPAYQDPTGAPQGAVKTPRNCC
jgi:hypothetical protein